MVAGLSCLLGGLVAPPGTRVTCTSDVTGVARPVGGWWRGVVRSL